MKYFLLKLRVLALIVGIMGMFPLSMQAATLAQNALYPGDLIRGSSSAVYYYGSDGRRYVFPNEKTYFTWYQDYSNVKLVPDDQLANLPLGRTNITYRPGKKMIKITSDPRVYVVDRGGFIYHVLSEGLAETLYGTSWRNQIEDVSDSFFSNYTEGPPISTANQFIPANVMTLTTAIDQDKQLREHQVTVNIGSPALGFTPPTFSIKVGTTVRWVNGDSHQHRISGQGWDSGILEPGQSYEHLFTEAGSFDYSCYLFRSMQGNINVIT